MKTLFFFLLANYILSMVIAYPYLSYGPTTEDLWAWLYAHVAFLSTFAILMMVLGLLLYPLTRFIKSPIQLFSIPPTLLFIFQVLLLIDVRIYEIFRYHINGLVINTITTEGAGDSVHLGRTTITILLLILTGILILEWGCLWGLTRYFSRHSQRVSHHGLVKRIPVVLFLLVFMVVMTDKIIFAYANFYDKTNIIRYQKLFPLYLPLFADETIEKYLGWKKEKSPIEYRAKSSLLNYPLKEFRMEENLKLINMVWIVIDSWRFDMLNEDLTPRIKKFSESSLVFENHYSGGNATRFGIYSMFYGIYGTYWHQILSERRSPVLIDVLQKMDYDFKILSSTQLSYPEFRKTAFVNLPPNAIEDRLPGNGGDDRDPIIAKKFTEFIKNHDRKRPFFSFMFLDAPHAPYRYPKEFARFQPAVDEINYFEVRKAHTHVDKNHPLFNRYRNAVFFSDSVVHEILKALREENLLDSTAVVITGDHGEEFYEAGYYGHTSAFSDFQIKVPLILYIPGEKPGKVTRLTSHLDVVPTMLSLMGSQMDPSLYSHGHSLTGKTGGRYVISSGWDTFAMIDPGATLVLSTEIYNARTAEVRTGQYQLADDPKPVLAVRTKQLLELTKNLSNFLK